jgi:hypothetical protein
LIWIGNYQLTLLPGSVLPFFKENTGRIGEEVYRVVSAAIRIEGDNICTTKDWKEVAAMYIKSPYVWGGKIPFGIDFQVLPSKYTGFAVLVYRAMLTSKQ